MISSRRRLVIARGGAARTRLERRRDGGLEHKSALQELLRQMLSWSGLLTSWKAAP